MSYFFFFYNILLGMFSCTMRMLKGMLLGVIFISRIDRTTLMQGFQTWDKGVSKLINLLLQTAYIYSVTTPSKQIKLIICIHIQDFDIYKHT